MADFCDETIDRTALSSFDLSWRRKQKYTVSMTSSPSEADPRLMFKPGNAPCSPEALNPFILLSLEQQSSVSFGHILINTSADEHFSVACNVHALLKKQCGFASSKK